MNEAFLDCRTAASAQAWFLLAAQPRFPIQWIKAVPFGIDNT
jgi:hypothetical protein